MADLKILALCGSLRKASFNRMTLNLVQEVAPKDLVFEEAVIGTLPFFDDDEFANGFPPAAVVLREKIRDADGIFFACPEYNHSLSGVLKNAIDWVSRPPDQPFAGKPVTVISATGGQQGGGRVQYHLRAVMLSLLVYFMPKPETFIGNAAAKFDKEGRCTDATTRKFVAEHMAAFREWVLLMKKLG